MACMCTCSCDDNDDDVYYTSQRQSSYSESSHISTQQLTRIQLVCMSYVQSGHIIIEERILKGLALMLKNVFC